MISSMRKEVIQLEQTIQLLGKRLRELRDKKSARMVANALYFTEGTIYKYESGNSTPSLQTFLDLCNYYGVTPNYLLGFEEEQK